MKHVQIAGLFLAITAPVLAIAQGNQSPTPQKPSPGSTTARAINTQGRSPAALNSRQISASENFYRPRETANNPVSGQPVLQVAPVRTTTPASAMGLAAPQPKIAAPMSALSNLQPSVIQAAATKSPSPEGSAAVDYRLGQLTLVSEKAPLGAVLKLIAGKTGAFVDLAPELQNEPVMAMLGPAPVREVLAELLDSPRIDYIVMGTGETPGSLERIVVRTRQAFARTAMAAVRRPQPQAPAEPANLNGTEVSSGVAAPAAAKLTQEQLMENWKKIREEKRLAEIEQQRQDRENESTQPQVEPQPEPVTENNQADNPPQR
jgi:hypothetical protein